jgi:hypothetical protein
MKLAQVVLPVRQRVSVPSFAFALILLLLGPVVLSTSAAAADWTRVRVRISPSTATVETGRQQQFRATVSGTTNQAVTWKVNGVSGGDSVHGTISTAGLYRAPSQVPSPAGVTVTAVSQARTTASGSAQVSIVPLGSLITVAISPTSASVQAGQTASFTATVSQDSQNKGVSWSLTGAGCSGTACGTLSAPSSASGTPIIYTAPAPIQSAATVSLTARSVANTSKTATATITVGGSQAVTVTISPKRAAITNIQGQPFSATVSGANTAVTWQVDTITGGNSGVGTIDANGNYTPPSAAGTHTITATSAADVTKSASALVAVTDLAGVLTYHNDLSRDGVNIQEYALNTLTVSTATFGKLFSCLVDGAVYAQPMWIPGLTVNGAKHNVIIAATQHESVYAFDADASPCVTLWHSNLIDASHGGTAGESSVPSGATGNLVGSGYGDISPEVGITGTPVIDPGTNTLYVVSKSVNASGLAFFQRLHALDLATGNEKFGGPANIDGSISVPGTGSGSAGGKVPFDPRNEHQRAGLVLSNGVVYATWASHEDHDPYHGWIIGFNASTLTAAPNAVFNSTPNQVGSASYSRGGIWMAGGAPAADATGNLYFITGNGTFDANTGGSNYGDSFVKLSTSNGLTVSDWFTPADQASLDANDTDYGSGGAAILVDQTTGPIPHLAIGGGKEGNLFLLNRDNMGHYNSGNPVVQIVNFGSSIFATAAFWQNTLFLAGTGPLKAYPFDPVRGQFSGANSSQSTIWFNFPGATPSVSSSGAANGIVWAIDTHLYCTPQSTGCGPAVLHAYDARNLGTELWNSAQASANRDQAGNAVKFAVPTVANGKVYIGTRTELTVYGLLPN